VLGDIVNAVAGPQIQSLIGSGFSTKLGDPDGSGPADSPLADAHAFETPSLGDLLMLASAVIRAVHVVTMHRLTEGRSDAPASRRPAVNTLTLTTVQLATCAVLFTVASAFVGDSVPVYLGTLGGGKLALFAYLVVICTVFAFFVQMWAVRRTSPARVSLLLGTEPLWAAVVGVGIAHDPLDAAAWCGMLLVLAGTFWGRRIEQRHREGAVGLRVDGPGCGHGSYLRFLHERSGWAVSD